MAELSLVERFNIKEMNAMKIINTAYKLPIVFVLDTSGSMQHNDNITKLNEGVNAFYDTILQDEEARLYMDICVVTFGQDGAKLHAAFGDLTEHECVQFQAAGTSPWTSGMLMALSLLEDQIDLYNEKVILSHPPIIITLTDGEPTSEIIVDGNVQLLTESMPEYKVTKKRFDFYCNTLKLDAYSIYFGDYIENRFFLEQFASSKNNVKRLAELNIQQFFKQLATSTSLLSKAVPTGESQLVMDYDIFSEYR